MEIIAKKVPSQNRLAFLPKYFGRLMMKAESMTYNALSNICSQYEGAYWEFYELSNGGFYMAPEIDGSLSLSVWGNHFEDDVSADAAGIISTLFMLNALCASSQNEKLVDCYYHLRDFALLHKEAGNILAAID